MSDKQNTKQELIERVKTCNEFYRESRLQGLLDDLLAATPDNKNDSTPKPLADVAEVIEEWNGLTRNPHLGMLIASNDVLVDWDELQKLIKAASHYEAKLAASEKRVSELKGVLSEIASKDRL